ncbi:MAG: tRNA (adenosine(37)-N6)-dimethylallyltransferase MiaA [Candidatus Hydrogenedens sp.]|nr:tRNA (adenosine(37)-N6)-dimethylallyltransferase MiaA [Candidatus Hydrogenedens sp.]
MASAGHNTLVVLGPTASGKTRLAVQLARTLGGEILSADSRQVYRGLDIGSGKDLSEYAEGGALVPYRLIDIADLDSEYSVFHFQRDCFAAWEDVTARGSLPIITGGTGLYLDAVLRGYRMAEVPEDVALRARLDALDDAALAAELQTLKPEQHNTTDTLDRARTIRAIEITTHEHEHPPEPGPPIRAVVLGALWPREELRKRIAARLQERLNVGMIEEVEALHARGVPWERLDLLGLEYRFVAAYLRGDLKNRNDLFQKLNAAIAQFAKRQDTWFRRMERNGTEIHWVPEARLDAALAILRTLS